MSIGLSVIYDFLKVLNPVDVYFFIKSMIKNLKITGKKNDVI